MSIFCFRHLLNKLDKFPSLPFLHIFLAALSPSTSLKIISHQYILYRIMIEFAAILFRNVTSLAFYFSMSHATMN